MTILKLLLEFFKVGFMILKWIKGFNDEEMRIFTERVTTVTTVFNKSVDSNVEAINEAAFITLLKKEQQIRFKKYKEITREQILNGAGVIEMSEINIFGYGQRAALNQEFIVLVFNEPITIEQKTFKIAKQLLEYNDE